MRAVVFDDFGSVPVVRELPDPVPPPGGAVIRVVATGLCRSDWHGWRGHDPDLRPPHVPGHEFAGVVAAVGTGVGAWAGGERVTAPFVCACGTCPSCQVGDQQVCERQTQPGFTHAGSFAEYVVVEHADVNLVRLPDGLDFGPAAALGCRFATAFRAVADQGRVAAGEWVAVYGCGGVGLSAVMVAAAAGARVVAVDVDPAALALAGTCGAEATVLSGPDVVDRVRAVTGGGAHLSLDAFGSPATCVASIGSLRRRGRHVQVGLLPPAAGSAAVPMDRVIGYELTILGSHGLAAHAYPRLLGLISAGRLRPQLLVTRTLALADAPAALVAMDGPTPPGVTLVRP